MLYREMKRNGIVPNERAIDTLMRRVDPSSLDSLGLQEARTLLQDAKAIGIDQQKIRDYKSLVSIPVVWGTGKHGMRSSFLFSKGLKEGLL